MTTEAQDTLFTRKMYLDKCGSEAHSRYYSQFVTPATIIYVVAKIGADKIRASTDHYMNNIRLWEWDQMEATLPFNRELVRVAGDYVTLSTVVCVAKEAARMWLTELSAEGDSD